jgi:hypothetical protein
LERGRARPTEPSAPDLEEQAAIVDPIEVLGSGAVPVLAVPAVELSSMDLAPDARHLVACVTGAHTIGAVFAMAKMTPEDGAPLLLDLIEKGVVLLR